MTVQKPKGMSKKQWDRWDNLAQKCFLFIYEEHLNALNVMSHPKTELSVEEWNTLCWNFAWQSAEFVNGLERS